MVGVNDRETIKALADAIEDRRREVGFDSVTDFAAAADVTAEGLRPLRRGEVRNYQERLTGPVCRVLGWTPDSIQRLMRGEPPILLVSQDEVTETLRRGREAVEALGYEPEPVAITPPDVALAARVAQLERDLAVVRATLEEAAEAWKAERQEFQEALAHVTQQASER